MAYTCSDYRAEMILMGLQRQLASKEIDEAQREKLRGQIKTLEKEMGIEIYEDD